MDLGQIRGGRFHDDRDFSANPEESEDHSRQSRLVFKSPEPCGQFYESDNTCSENEGLNRKIFVGGLSPFVDSDDLKETFEETFGPVVSAVVIKNHASAQVHSRGFGFVTFKHETSASSAVRAHYVQIFGRKVEIKNALARSHLGKAEDVPISEHQVSAEVLKESDTRPPTPASCSSENLNPRWNPDVWVPRFKQWLPKFLAEVSNRLKEGEWYPMSSLKGDFRATCGLELDHRGIGYMKLNDFLRTLPELCKMKIAPVGLGPATQIVLVPAKTRMITWRSHGLKTEELNSESPTASLVDTGGSYPAVTCEGSASNTNLEDAAAASTCSQLTSSKESADNSTSASIHPESAGSPNRASVFSIGSQNGASSEPHDICSVELNYLRRRIALLEDIVERQNDLLSQNSWWNKRGPFSINRSNVHDNTFHAFGNPETFGRISDALDSSLCQDPYNSLRLSTNTPLTIFKEEIISAVKEVRDHEVKNLLNHEESSAPYTLWGQNLSNIQDRPNILGQHLSPEYNERESGSRTANSHGGHMDQGPLQREHWSLFSLKPSDQKGGHYFYASCVFHCKRQSSWIAVPCKHLTLCSACKDACCKLERNAPCPVCHCAVERWIALHI